MFEDKKEGRGLMPRGRKKSPQDSIDSILLAMSRRSDIDSGTLSHYFDRLDEEWTEGARDKVLHLLRTNDTSAHSAAVLILTELATGFDLRELEKFVADPTVSDMAKLSLAPVLKELGSDIVDDRIIEYLNDPETAMHQMQARLLELVGQSELGAESVLEDVTSMPVERRLGFVNWLGQSGDARAVYLLIPLMEHQPAKVATAAIDALEQLGTAAARQTIPALNYLIANSTNRQLKQQARTVLGRLTMQSAPGVEDAAMTRAQQQLPLYQARVSFIDGTGSQMIMISWQRPDGLLKGVNVLYQDHWGIKDCYGTDSMETGRWLPRRVHSTSVRAANCLSPTLSGGLTLQRAKYPGKMPSRYQRCCSPTLLILTLRSWRVAAIKYIKCRSLNRGFSSHLWIFCLTSIATGSSIMCLICCPSGRTNLVVGVERARSRRNSSGQTWMHW